VRWAILWQTKNYKRFNKPREMGCGEREREREREREIEREKGRALLTQRLTKSTQEQSLF